MILQKQDFPKRPSTDHFNQLYISISLPRVYSSFIFLCLYLKIIPLLWLPLQASASAFVIYLFWILRTSLVFPLQGGVAHELVILVEGQRIFQFGRISPFEYCL